MNEKIKTALPYPPKKVTRAPIKKTTVAVNNLPILKQNPVAEALTTVGNNCGMYTDNAPWLIPKKKANIPISINVITDTSVFNLNTTNTITKQTAKHIIIVLRRPIAFTTHPEIILPVKPATANIIIVKPRSCCAFAASPVILCIHVGAHEKTAHRPISIAPNIREPVSRFFLYPGAKSFLLK